MKQENEALHERWRRDYRKVRYAQHLSRSELNKRLRDLFLNMLRVMPDTKIGVFPVDARTGIMWEKWTHVLEEMVLRYGPYPNGFDRDILHSEPFPDFASELAGKAAKRMAELDLKPGSVFIKLGRKRHMEQLLIEGGLRLQPATFYSKPELNQAVRDDEMTIPLSFVLDRKQLRKLVMNPDDGPHEAPQQRIDLEFRSTADFWLYCVSRSIEPRLFVDFNAEACVVIKNPGEFARRLREGTLAAAGTTMTEAKAVYVDPLLPTSAKIYVPFSKPFGYMYQDEYRFCWVPNPLVPKLEHLDIKIGGLGDIAELIVL